MIQPIRKTIEVPCNSETAFRIFVDNIATWWPLDGHSVSAMAGFVAKSVVLEPRVGGRVYEIAHDDQHHQWGTVRAFKPAEELSIDWHINVPPEQATQVHVLFTQLNNVGTRVDLTHSNWEVLGDRASGMRDGYNNGWVNVFERRFREACEA